MLVRLWFVFSFMVLSGGSALAETVKLLGVTRDRGVVIFALKATQELSADLAEKLLRDVVEQEKAQGPLAVYTYLYPHDARLSFNPLVGQKDAFDAVSFMLNDGGSAGWVWSYKYSVGGNKQVFTDCSTPKRLCHRN